jgi:hypothetical protein
MQSFFIIWRFPFPDVAKTLIFLVDHPNETEKNRITKFSYSGHPNNRIFGYSGEKPNSVLRVTQTHPNAPEFSDNRPKPFGSLAKK